MQQSFKAYMQENYTHNELADIAQHGCESVCATGMIYYAETEALFDLYRDDLFEIMDEWMYEKGQAGISLPDYVAKRTGTFTLFANAVVWFCAELIAYELTQGEYIDETEDAAPLAQQDTHATHVVRTKDLTVDEKVALADRLNLNGRIIVIDAVIAAYKMKIGGFNREQF